MRRYLLVIVAVGLAARGADTRADLVDPTVRAEIAGTCEQVLVAGASSPCPIGPVRFVHHPSRRTGFQVDLEGGRLYGFSGRPMGGKPGDYRLRVSWITRQDDPAHPAATLEATGECRASTTPDGAIWRRLDCEARDLSGARYRLVLRGDGRRIVFVQRGQEVGPPFAP